MKVEVKLFARAAELAGEDVVSIELQEPVCVGEVREALASEFPELASLLPSMHFAVGTDYATDDAPVKVDAKLAAFPPVSGG